MESCRTTHLFKLGALFCALQDYLVSQQEHKMLFTLCQVSRINRSKQFLPKKPLLLAYLRSENEIHSDYIYMTIKGELAAHLGTSPPASKQLNWC